MNTVLLTIVGPRGRADVAVPADTPVAGLLGSLAELTARGEGAPGGWELAPAGSPPLDGGRTLADEAVVDGCVLHLRRAGATRLAPAAPARSRGPQNEDAGSPLQRTRDELPEWFSRGARLGPALRAWTKRKRGTDVGRIERARACWSAAGYETRLDEQIRAPRLRRTVTIAVAGVAPGAGVSTISALLATLFAGAGAGRDRPVVVDRIVDGEPQLRPPGHGGLYILDHGSALADPAIARADQLVLVCDAATTTPALMAQAADTLAAGAPPLVVVANMTARSGPQLDPDGLERALPHARGVLGVRHDPRRAHRVADGTFAWADGPGLWGTELRELAAVLAGDWERLGLAAAPLRM